MATISVGELRQNPTAALRAVERDGVEFVVTNHNRPVARLVPVDAAPWVPAERTAALRALGGDPAWLAEWDAERSRDRLGEDPAWSR